MVDVKARRAFRNYVMEQLDRYENYGDDFCGDICSCCEECDCAGTCGTDRCIDKLIEFYGGDNYEGN